MKHRRSEVADELNLSLGVASGSRYRQHTNALGTILETKASCKHAVTGRVLEYVVRAATHHPQATSHGNGPFVQVAFRV